MKLEDALKLDFSQMSPQQRSHLRKRLLLAGKPLPPELDRKRGQSDIVVPSTPDEGPWKCTVVDASGKEHPYTVEDENGRT